MAGALESRPEGIVPLAEADGIEGGKHMGGRKGLDPVLGGYLVSTIHVHQALAASWYAAVRYEMKRVPDLAKASFGSFCTISRLVFYAMSTKYVRPLSYGLFQDSEDGGTRQFQIRKWKRLVACHGGRSAEFPARRRSGRG